MADKDFDALRLRLIALARSVFPDWSDFAVASFGNVLLELYAFVGDVVGYYLDNQARESRLVTATQRKNVIALARMLGYKLHGARAATAEAVFLARAASAEVRIAAGTVARTREVTEPVRFQLLGTVTVTYKTGGGASGNVDAGRIVVVEGTFTDAHGRAAQVSVTNAEPASGGTDRQSVASAKLLAPESLRTLTRSVTREDFEVNARRVPGVARALMLTSNEDPTAPRTAASSTLGQRDLGDRDVRRRRAEPRGLRERLDRPHDHLRRDAWHRPTGAF